MSVGPVPIQTLGREHQAILLGAEQQSAGMSISGIVEDKKVPKSAGANAPSAAANLASHFGSRMNNGNAAMLTHVADQRLASHMNNSISMGAPVAVGRSSDQVVHDQASVLPAGHEQETRPRQMNTSTVVEDHTSRGDLGRAIDGVISIHWGEHLPAPHPGIFGGGGGALFAASGTSYNVAGGGGLPTQQQQGQQTGTTSGAGRMSDGNEDGASICTALSQASNSKTNVVHQMNSGSFGGPPGPVGNIEVPAAQRVAVVTTAGGNTAAVSPGDDMSVEIEITDTAADHAAGRNPQIPTSASSTSSAMVVPKITTNELGQQLPLFSQEVSPVLHHNANFTTSTNATSPAMLQHTASLQIHSSGSTPRLHTDHIMMTPIQEENADAHQENMMLLEQQYQQQGRSHLQLNLGTDLSPFPDAPDRFTPRTASRFGNIQDEETDARNQQHVVLDHREEGFLPIPQNNSSALFSSNVNMSSGNNTSNCAPATSNASSLFSPPARPSRSNVQKEMGQGVQVELHAGEDESSKRREVLLDYHSQQGRDIITSPLHEHQQLDREMLITSFDGDRTMSIDSMNSSDARLSLGSLVSNQSTSGQAQHPNRLPMPERMQLMSDDEIQPRRSRSHRRAFSVDGNPWADEAMNDANYDKQRFKEKVEIQMVLETTTSMGDGAGHKDMSINYTSDVQNFRAPGGGGTAPPVVQHSYSHTMHTTVDVGATAAGATSSTTGGPGGPSSPYSANMFGLNQLQQDGAPRFLSVTTEGLRVTTQSIASSQELPQQAGNTAMNTGALPENRHDGADATKTSGGAPTSPPTAFSPTTKSLVQLPPADIDSMLDGALAENFEYPLHTSVPVPPINWMSSSNSSGVGGAPSPPSGAAHHQHGGEQPQRQINGSTNNTAISNNQAGGVAQQQQPMSAAAGGRNDFQKHDDPGATPTAEIIKGNINNVLGQHHAGTNNCNINTAAAMMAEELSADSSYTGQLVEGVPGAGTVPTSNGTTTANKPGNENLSNQQQEQLQSQFHNYPMNANLPLSSRDRTLSQSSALSSNSGGHLGPAHSISYPNSSHSAGGAGGASSFLNMGSATSSNFYPGGGGTTTASISQNMFSQTIHSANQRTTRTFSEVTVGSHATTRNTRTYSEMTTGSQAEYSNPDQTIIIFDWDDTLCPSYYVKSCGLLVNDPNADFDKLAARFPHREIDPKTGHVKEKSVGEEMQENLYELAKIGENCIRTALRFGRVVIITNAETGWTQVSCRKWLPTLLPLLSSMTVISARSTFEPKGVESPAGWKTHAFKEVIEAFYSRYPNQRWKNVLALGDGRADREALHRVTEERLSEGCRQKNVKFIVKPSLDTLKKQLVLFTDVLEHLVFVDDHVDIRIEEKHLQSFSPSSSGAAAPGGQQHQDVDQHMHHDGGGGGAHQQQQHDQQPNMPSTTCNYAGHQEVLHDQHMMDQEEKGPDGVLPDEMKGPDGVLPDDMKDILLL
ncbi:unnamed protein product [Amoebophrya sp. A120]|nr:unnamed protein product [Amoebophrya sp. A120]|eukprot:GSA120T00016434001.1